MSESNLPLVAARGRVRSRSYVRISRGLYLPAVPRPLMHELCAWALVLPPTAAFTHLTAAQLHGWRMPADIDHPIFAAMREVDSRPRRPGLYVCRHPQPVAMNVVAGLRVTTAAETLLAAARDLGVLDLVILGDSALRLKHCTVADLWATARQRRRGAPMLRRVIPLLDPRSESAWESMMRVLHRAAEIEVEPQYRIFDQHGRFVARADLRIVGTRRLHEYDGAGHREAEVQRADLARDRAIVLTAWERMGYTSREVLYDGAQIIASADAVLGRTWDPRRLAAWNGLIDRSLYGRAGRARAYRQWRRSQRPELGS